MVGASITICTFLTLTNSFKLFDQNSVTQGEPSTISQMLALNIFDTFYGRNGWEGVGQAKAVIFFIIVAVIALALRNRLLMKRGVQGSNGKTDRQSGKAVRRAKHGWILTLFFSILAVFYLYPIFLLINSLKKIFAGEKSFAFPDERSFGIDKLCKGIGEDEFLCSVR